MDTIKIRDWRKWEIVIPASTQSACVRRNPDTGNCYKWISGGKRIIAERVIL